jgi:hypothetical protein
VAYDANFVGSAHTATVAAYLKHQSMGGANRQVVYLPTICLVPERVKTRVCIAPRRPSQWCPTVWSTATVAVSFAPDSTYTYCCTTDYAAPWDGWAADDNATTKSFFIPASEKGLDRRR